MSDTKGLLGYLNHIKNYNSSSTIKYPIGIYFFNIVDLSRILEIQKHDFKEVPQRFFLTPRLSGLVS